MMTILAGALLAVTTLSAPAAAQTAPVSAFVGDISADASAEALKERCDRFAAEVERRFTELENAPGPYTVDTTLKAYDDLSAIHYSGGAEFYSYNQSADSAEKRQIGQDCYTRLDEIGTRMGLSRPIYDHLKAIDISGADAPTRYYLKKTLEEYERNGVAFDQARRDQIKALSDELTAISAEFDANIAKSTRTIKALPSELEGMPQDWIASHPVGDDGLVTISTDPTDYSPIMSYAQNDALREKLARSYLARAYPENDVLLGQLFTKRQQLAEMLGRPNYAALVFENRMLNSTEKLEAHIADLAQAATPAMQRDLAELRAALAEIRPGQELTIFNSGIAEQHLLKTRYNLDPQEVRQYFTYNNVRRGIFELTEDLFGFQIRDWDTPVWHPDVEAFEIYDGNTLLGRFYFDSHPRDGKYKHANHIGLRKGVTGEMVPVSVLTMNLPRGDYDTGLMEHGDVETFLHEFGHLIHSILGGNQRWMALSGVANERDFTEAPSQMLEEWVYDYETLARFARNEKGEVIPRDLVDRMRAARNFGEGAFEMGQLSLTNASLKFHQGAPADPSAQGITDAYKAYRNEYTPLPHPANTHHEATFGHLTGYSAGYYTYGWSRVIAADLFGRFEAAGLRDKATADAYRRLILEPGGSRPTAELIEEFLGRPVNADAFKKKLLGED